MSAVIMSLMVPAAMALDVCGQGFLFIVSEPEPVDIACETGYTIVSNSTVNLRPGAHISEAVGGAGGGILDVEYGSTNTINIHGGQIDTYLSTASTDIVTVYGSDFAVDGNPVSGQIVITGNPYIFTLTGLYKDGSSINLPCHLQNGGIINLDTPEPPTAPDINVTPETSPWDVGDVEVGQILTDPVLVVIYNYGNAPLTVTSVDIPGDSSFSISPVDPTIEFPLTIEPSFEIGVDFDVFFAPLAEGFHTATVTIKNDDEDVEIAFTGVGVITEIPPTQQIQDILDFLDTSVAIGTIQGYGPGNSVSKRLKALRNMIESVSDLIDAGDYAQAVDQLESIDKKTDGAAKPQDFVVGGAVSELNAMINDLIADLAS
ncbi:MAG: hypothetical protein ACYSOW_10370 [Planctomycetota bacterium]